MTVVPIASLPTANPTTTTRPRGAAIVRFGVVTATR